MKQIEKGREPKRLEEHRAKGGDFDGLPKDELRRQLLNEQGYICCYCMKRIPQTMSREQIEKNYPSSKIAHVLSQDNHSNQQLNYQNLLIACNGNHGQPIKVQTCDTFQKNKDFHFNPAGRRNIEEFIKYKANGEIYSDDEFLNRELVEVLNLNTFDLKRIREGHYKFYRELIEREGKSRQGKDIQKRFYESEKQKLLSQQEGKFFEYCMVGVYLLNKRLSKLN
ncbi:MAG: TIGR02646 family protein [Bacteroidota bacterium]|nr:TIGR02646 family protein [Bacteroidota bacterium]